MGVVIPPAGGHGGDGPRIARALGIDPAQILDLSQTLNPFAPDVGAMVASSLEAVGHYPDPTVASACLADALGVDPARLLLTNGGSEAISLVARELGGRVASEPEFALHPRGEGGPIWRSNPHSPSGHLAGASEHADVWDEAFFSMAAGRWSAGRPGVVVGSLTKLFACPGLRLGYIIADEGDADGSRRFARHQPGWSVGSVALAVLPKLLEYSSELPAWARKIAEAKSDLVSALTQRGFTVDAQDAPWVLVKAEGLRDRLAHQGIVVRDCTSFGMPGIARIAVPDGDGLARLVAALDLNPDAEHQS